MSKIQRVATLTDWRWAREKSPGFGRAVFSTALIVRGVSSGKVVVMYDTHVLRRAHEWATRDFIGRRRPPKLRARAATESS